MVRIGSQNRGLIPHEPGVAAKLLFVLIISAVVTCILTVAVWPGEMKLLEPIFCTDAQPDAFVVSDSYSVRPGETSYQFTMYCMGERGDVTEVGLGRPLAILFGAHFIIAAALVFRPRRRAKEPEQPNGPIGVRS